MLKRLFTKLTALVRDGDDSLPLYLQESVKTEKREKYFAKVEE